MTPAALADLVRTVAHEVLVDRGVHGAELPATVTVERPHNREHGDYATTVALQTDGVASREFAEWLAEALRGADGLRSAEAAGPGFLNLRLTPGTQTRIVDEMLAAGDGYGTAGTPPRFDPERAPVRTRAGAMVTMAELVEAPRTDDNPLFVVQYAHSRLAALARNAVDLGVTAEGADLSLLRDEREGELIATLGEFGEVVTRATRRDEPHRLARYLEQLADAFHEFAGSCRVLPMGDERAGPRHDARLALCHATRQVLANGLRLLGVSAPERM